MKNAILWALVVLSFFGSIYAHLRIRDIENGLRLQELTLEGLQKRTTRPAAEHRYRFERNGGSLWRYDEATGESCQVTSNQIDNWTGGRCSTTPEPQPEELKAFTEVLCKDNPNSDACKELLKGKQ